MMDGSSSMVRLQSTIICPECGHRKTEVMPTDACLFFYECENCQTRLRPKPGDCCVFCSYATLPCPPVQDAVRAVSDSTTRQTDR